MNHEPFVAFVRELAEASAQVILPYFGSRDMGLELKSDASPVTLADRGAEKVMREMIARRFPEHGIIGEEFGTERGDAEYVWVLDPVDGTKVSSWESPSLGLSSVCSIAVGPLWDAFTNP